MENKNKQLDKNKFTPFSFNLEKTALDTIDRINNLNSDNYVQDTRTSIATAVNNKLQQGLQHLINQLDKNTHWYMSKKDLYSDITKSLKFCKDIIDDKTALQQKLKEINIKANDYLSQNQFSDREIFINRKEAIICVANSLKNIDDEFNVISKIDSDYNIDSSLDNELFYYSTEDEKVFDNNNEFDEDLSVQPFASKNKQPNEKQIEQKEITK